MNFYTTLNSRAESIVRNVLNVHLQRDTRLTTFKCEWAKAIYKSEWGPILSQAGGPYANFANGYQRCTQPHIFSLSIPMENTMCSGQMMLAMCEPWTQSSYVNEDGNRLLGYSLKLKPTEKKSICLSIHSTGSILHPARKASSNCVSHCVENPEWMLC